MQGKLILFILTGLLSLSIVSCGSAVQDEPVVAPTQEESQKDSLKDENPVGTEAASEGEKSAVDEKADAEEVLGEEAGENQADDSDMGSTGEGYPNGTMYLCNFSGQFTQPVKVNDHTYSMQ